MDVDILTKRIQMDVLQEMENKLNEKIIKELSHCADYIPGLISARNMVDSWIKDLEK
jgi:hypothetical protein